MQVNLNDLADRVDALMAPDREVDDAIIDAFGWRNDFGVAIPPAGFVGTPMYTASIDHAMTLVPDGARALIDSSGCHCLLTRDDWAWPGFGGLASSMARAVVSAALRSQVGS